MKRFLFLCLLLPLLAFGQQEEYYYAQSTGNLNYVLYTAKQQEPYKAIASRFGLSVQELMYLNGGNVHSIASVGDQLIVPLTSKNFFRWKDIPADISAQPVYVQLKKVTDLQEICHRFHLRAEYFANWNDTRETRFDAGAELIVGFVNYITEDNLEERPISKTYPFSSSEREIYNESGNGYEEEKPVPSVRNQKIVKQTKPVVYEEESSPVVIPKKQKMAPSSKQVAREYEEETEPVVVPKKTKPSASQAKQTMKVYEEDDEEAPVILPKKVKANTPPSKRVVKEYVEEEAEEPVVTAKKPKIATPQTKRVPQNYSEEEEEPVVITKKTKMTSAPKKPVYEEEMEEVPAPVVRRTPSATKPLKQAVREVVEEEEPMVATKRVRTTGNQAIKEYEEQEEPVVVTKKVKAVTSQPKRVVKEYEEEEPIVTAPVKKIVRKTQPVNTEYEEEEFEETPKPKSNPKLVESHTGSRYAYKTVTGKMDSEPAPQKSRSKKVSYNNAEENETSDDGMNEVVEKPVVTSKTYKQPKVVEEEEYDPRPVSTKGSTGKTSSSKNNSVKSKKSGSNKNENTDEGDVLTDDGVTLNEVPLEISQEEETPQPKKVVKSSRTKKPVEHIQDDSEETASNVSNDQVKPEKANQRGGRATLFLSALGKKGTKHYVVTNLAPRGETIVITNSSNGKYITAEVIGPLPVRELSKGVLLKVSENAKEDLDVRTNYFNVIVNY